MNLDFEPSKGWDEKLDDHILNIKRNLSYTKMNIVKNYPMDRENDENVHNLIINS